MSNSDNYKTPEEFYKVLDNEFHFDDDPCPLHGELKENGLTREWGGSTFMNPPYSKPAPWCKKALEESMKGKTVVGLLRGDTSTNWFHEYVLPFAEIRFIKGRIKFNGSPAPFNSIIAIWRGNPGFPKVGIRENKTGADLKLAKDSPELLTGKNYQ